MTKEAFCPLLYLHNGGILDKNGGPTGPPVRSLCDVVEDCAYCDIMQHRLSLLPANSLHRWMCPSCIDSSLKKYPRLGDSGVRIQLPGFYTEGLCQNEDCIRDRGEVNDTYSPLLQLIIIEHQS